MQIHTILFIVHQKLFISLYALCSDTVKSNSYYWNYDMLTFPVNLWTTQRETVTVTVLFMKPALVTTPVNAIGGIVG